LLIFLIALFSPLQESSKVVSSKMKVLLMRDNHIASVNIRK
jgi:hypothetical protein